MLSLIIGYSQLFSPFRKKYSDMPIARCEGMYENYDNYIIEIIEWSLARLTFTPFTSNPTDRIDSSALLFWPMSYRSWSGDPPQHSQQIL